MPCEWSSFHMHRACSSKTFEMRLRSCFTRQRQREFPSHAAAALWQLYVAGLGQSACYSSLSLLVLYLFFSLLLHILVNARAKQAKLLLKHNKSASIHRLSLFITKASDQTLVARTAAMHELPQQQPDSV
jgi:hypothetical protein